MTSKLSDTTPGLTLSRRALRPRRDLMSRQIQCEEDWSPVARQQSGAVLVKGKDKVEGRCRKQHLRKASSPGNKFSRL